ncbi:MAG: hypothetical protein ACOC2D_05475 [Spirochaetota bacterium]
MSTARSLAPWIVAGVALIVTIVFFYVDPFATPARGPQERGEELESMVGKAATYYEFGHFDRAAESYAVAIERGMDDALGWYRYAHSLEMAEGINLEAYLEAYRRLLEQDPRSEYVSNVELILAEYATAFEYDAAIAGDLPEGRLVQLEGTVTKVVWGRVRSGVDTLCLATEPDDWLGHVGNEVRVEAARHRRFCAGDTLSVIGLYEGLCTTDENAGLSRAYPCVSAAAARLVSGP